MRLSSDRKKGKNAAICQLITACIHMKQYKKLKCVAKRSKYRIGANAFKLLNLLIGLFKARKKWVT
jgi:hypothetical protein